MADEHELRRVNWIELFSFTQIFRSFHVAMHVSKLVLAVAALTLLFCFGWLLDVAWWAANRQAHPQEISWYVSRPGGDFDQMKDDWQRDRLKRSADLLTAARHDQATFDNFPVTSPYLGIAFRERIQRVEPKGQPADVLKDAREGNITWRQLLKDAESAFDAETEAIAANLEGAGKLAQEKLSKDEAVKANEKAQAQAQLERDESAAWRRLTDLKVAFDRRLRDIRGDDVSSVFRDFEFACFKNALSAVAHGNIFSGMSRYQALSAGQDKMLADSVMLASQGSAPAQVAGEDGAGFFFWLLMAAQGIAWLITEHYVYAILFLAFALAVWALFGGAIHRMAALQAARGEKISVAQALKFSISKFGSFVTAPLLPLAIILGIGVLMALFSLIVFPMPIIGGLVFFLLLLGGLAIAFLLVGLVAGGPLMYPTIAVEGSDSFDAISRSFTYVISRPWRSALYGLIALVYGTITYLFVRLFVYLALAGTHFFIKWFIWWGGQSLGQDADKIDVLWIAPTFDNLWGTHNWQAMSTLESIGAFFISVWVFLLAASVAGYVMSFLASSSTIIYLLLRRQVDATDLDDVYIDEAEEPGPAVTEVKPEVVPAETSPASTSQSTAEPTTPPAEGQQTPPASQA